MSRLSFGAMTFGTGFAPVTKVDEALARQLVHRALDRGVNLIDTADSYANGASEEILGRALKGRRGEVLLQAGCAALAALDAVASARGASRAQVALAWLLAKRGVTSVIVGASSIEQLDENLAAADLALEAEEIARLDAATAPAPLYPAFVDRRFRYQEPA